MSNAFTTFSARLLGGLLLGAFVFQAAGQVSGKYDFTLNPAASGFDAQFSTSASTAGTLIGNYIAETNPTGTRTKPGLFGTFGDTENVPVAVQFTPRLSGPINTAPVGGFSLDVDAEGLTLGLSNYAVDFIGLAGSVGMPLTVTLSTESFRTRNPSSTYPGGIPVTLPFGEASLLSMSAAQIGTAGGVLTPTGDGTFDFVVVPIVQFDLTFSILGDAFTLPQAPAPFPLAGSLVFSDGVATLLSVIPLGFDESVDIEQALPEFPLPLPTVFPPGSTADVILSLMLSNIAAELAGTLTTSADGVLVPGPGVLAMLGIGAAVAAPRRRRSSSRG